MGIFSRFADIVNSNLNAILDKAEDPQKLVRLMIQEMEDTLVEVRSAAARTLADRKTLLRRLGSLEQEAAEWARKAELAVQHGRDDLAKAALAEKARLGAAVERAREQEAVLADGIEKLNDDIARLEAKLADARAKQRTLLARHDTASRRLRVREQAHGTRIDDALLRFEQFERKLEHTEARVEAYDLGRRPDLSAEFDELASADRVEQELAALKARVGREDAAGRERE